MLLVYKIVDEWINDYRYWYKDELCSYLPVPVLVNMNNCFCFWQEDDHSQVCLLQQLPRSRQHAQDFRIPGAALSKDDRVSQN